MRKSTSVQPRPEKMLQTLEHVSGTALSWHTIPDCCISTVVHTAQNNRERRKQIREYVNGLYANLTELETLAIGYHTSAREESKEAEIISKLGRLACFNTLPRFKSQRWLFREPLNKLDCRWNLLRSFRVEAPAGFCDCAQNDASFGRGMTDGRGIGARCTVTLRASRRVQAPPMDLFRGSLEHFDSEHDGAFKYQGEVEVSRRESPWKLFVSTH